MRTLIGIVLAALMIGVCGCATGPLDVQPGMTIEQVDRKAIAAWPVATRCATVIDPFSRTVRTTFVQRDGSVHSYTEVEMDSYGNVLDVNRWAFTGYGL
jgi:heterodisulfide reductase subunit A-like polyferredoxin